MNETLKDLGLTPKDIWNDISSPSVIFVVVTCIVVFVIFEVMRRSKK